MADNSNDGDSMSGSTIAADPQPRRIARVAVTPEMVAMFGRQTVRVWNRYSRRYWNQDREEWAPHREWGTVFTLAEAMRRRWGNLVLFEEATAEPSAEGLVAPAIAAGEPPFWLVWSPEGCGPPRHQHANRASAEAEAERLAGEHPGQTFYVVDPSYRVTIGGTARTRYAAGAEDEVPF